MTQTRAGLRIRAMRLVGSISLALLPSLLGAAPETNPCEGGLVRTRSGRLVPVHEITRAAIDEIAGALGI